MRVGFAVNEKGVEVATVVQVPGIEIIHVYAVWMIEPGWVGGWLVVVTGWGGAGFHKADPTLTWCWGRGGEKGPVRPVTNYMVSK